MVHLGQQIVTVKDTEAEPIGQCPHGQQEKRTITVGVQQAKGTGTINSKQNGHTDKTTKEKG